MSRASINMVNLDVMMDMAWRKVFGRTVEAGERVALKAIGIAKVLGESCFGSDLTASVAIQAGVSRPTADSFIADAEYGPDKLIVWQASGGDGRRKIYDFAPGIVAKLDDVERLRVEIVKAWALQCASPDDPVAGRDVLSDPDLYFNLTDPANREAYQSAIAAKKLEHKQQRLSRLAAQLRGN